MVGPTMESSFLPDGVSGCDGCQSTCFPAVRRRTAQLSWSVQLAPNRDSEDADFHGQMDEVRVWKVVRTEAEIRQNMFSQPYREEPDLVGLWNFDDGTATTPRLANTMEKWLGPPGSPSRPCRHKPNHAVVQTEGQVDRRGWNAVTNATILVESNGTEIARATADRAGCFLADVAGPRRKQWILKAVTPDDRVGSQAAVRVVPYGEQTIGPDLKNLPFHVAGKVIALDGKTPHAMLVIELVQPRVQVATEETMLLPPNPKSVSEIRGGPPPVGW
jgi:hypothetical protein